MNCVDCGSFFEPARGGRPRIRCFGCNPAVRKTGPRKPHRRPRWRSLRSAVCARCTRTFTAKLPHERFCSRRCGTAANNRAKQEAARDRSGRPCRSCGASFAPAYGNPRRIYCGEQCARRQHALRTTGKAHERRARRFGGAVERVDKLKVFERDGWRCLECGVRTPRRLCGTALPNAPELDHIKPLSRGGDHTYANTRCTCRRCNQRKGACVGVDDRLS
jgi:hypothetical protein